MTRTTTFFSVTLNAIIRTVSEQWIEIRIKGFLRLLSEWPDVSFLDISSRGYPVRSGPTVDELREADDFMCCDLPYQYIGYYHKILYSSSFHPTSNKVSSTIVPYMSYSFLTSLRILQTRTLIYTKTRGCLAYSNFAINLILQSIWPELIPLSFVKICNTWPKDGSQSCQSPFQLKLFLIHATWQTFAENMFQALLIQLCSHQIPLLKAHLKVHAILRSNGGAWNGFYSRGSKFWAGRIERKSCFIKFYAIKETRLE